MITVREASAQDVPCIVEIASITISTEWNQAYVKDRLSRDDTVIFVAEDDGLLIGFAAFRRVGDDGELLQIATFPECRRRGAGGLLLSKTLSFARECGLNSVFLEVRRSNAAAISLYEKFDFKQVRIRKDYYTDPVDDAIVMAREAGEQEASESR